MHLCIKKGSVSFNMFCPQYNVSLFEIWLERYIMKKVIEIHIIMIAFICYYWGIYISASIK